MKIDDLAPVERVARARADLRGGLPIAVAGTQGIWLAAAVETIGEVRLADIVAAAGAMAVLALTARRARTLKARVYHDDVALVALPQGAGMRWLHAVADPYSDLCRPLKGPLLSLRGADPAPARAAIALVKSARLLPVVLLVPIADPSGRLPGFLTYLSLDDLSSVHAQGTDLIKVAAASLPLSAGGARCHLFRNHGGDEEHLALELGHPPRDQPVLVRLHSACFTGDVLGSLKCDCGAQLNAAIAGMAKEGAGLLLYLSQEGRGIGLANKLRAYSLQDQGFDTVEANHRLGFEGDERDFRIGAQILGRMGFKSARLMTNNPAKMAMMESAGIKVIERVPLIAGLNQCNHEYLATKARKQGHLL